MIDTYRWQRPVLPTAEILMVPSMPVAAEPTAEPQPVEIPQLAAEPAAPPQIPAQETGPAAEKRLETQLGPSVDAARLIN